MAIDLSRWSPPGPAVSAPTIGGGGARMRERSAAALAVRADLPAPAAPPLLVVVLKGSAMGSGADGGRLEARAQWRIAIHTIHMSAAPLLLCRRGSATARREVHRQACKAQRNQRKAGLREAAHRLVGRLH